MLNKFAKGVDEKITRNSKFFASISHLKAQSLVDDNLELVKNLRKRKLALMKDHTEVVAKQPPILTASQTEIDNYYKNLNSKLKVILTDDEISTYLKSNQRSFGQRQIYYFKLKLKHKVLDPRHKGGF